MFFRKKSQHLYYLMNERGLLSFNKVEIVTTEIKHKCPACKGTGECSSCDGGKYASGYGSYGGRDHCQCEDGKCITCGGLGSYFEKDEFKYLPNFTSSLIEILKEQQVRFFKNLVITQLFNNIKEKLSIELYFIDNRVYKK